MGDCPEIPSNPPDEVIKMSEHKYMTYGDCETVLTGYANGITRTKSMITPVFNVQTVYAVGDYCIYNNGLYKCSTAHTGAWSANDFDAVSVMDEVKNASGGGGGLSETRKLVLFDRTIDTMPAVTDLSFPYFDSNLHSSYPDFNDYFAISIWGWYQYSENKTNAIRFPMLFHIDLIKVQQINGSQITYSYLQKTDSKGISIRSNAEQTTSGNAVKVYLGAKNNNYQWSYTPHIEVNIQSYPQYMGVQVAAVDGTNGQISRKGAVIIDMTAF